ncbi:type VI secretion protein [Streptomyces albireticuli]|uniref:Type VI secretion protein n=1 Tax=Streptomyces albireticuli TaxID=1940 RepID=A0A2A2DHL3_9ACTN|nr:type VI secretion protein [Streptomyces albireticuli]
MLVGAIALLLGLTLLVWVTTGLAAFFAHGSWPEGVSLPHTPMALRHLLTRPSDLPAAWPDARADALSGYGLFWGLLIGELLVLIVLGVFVIGTLARWRAVRARRREELRAGGRETGAPRTATQTWAETQAEAPTAVRSAPATPAGREAVIPRAGEPSGTGAATGTEAGAAGAARAGGTEAGAAGAETGPDGVRAGTGATGGAGPAVVGGPAAPSASLGARTGLTPNVVPAQPSGAAQPVERPGAPTTAGSVTAASGSVTAAAGATGVPLAATSHVSRVLYGADRQGVAARLVREAAGPVLVTTADPGLWGETKDARAKLGPVHVFDPGHLLDTPDRLRWSPTAGCGTRETAAARATALLAPVRPLSALDSATADTAETLLRCWLHAAAVGGRPFRHVHRWAQGNAAHEPVRILRTHPKAAGGAAGELESALTGHPERKDMAQELTSRALNSLSSLHIRDACNPNRADSLAWESFIAEGGTLYVVGEAIEDPRARPGAMPLLTALAASVVEHGRGMAARSSSGRLDPPLTLVLDDVAAVAPLPALPELLTTGAEHGIPTYALMRSEEQARARWPHRALVG